MDSDTKPDGTILMTRANQDINRQVHRSNCYSHIDFNCLNIMYNDKHLCDVVLIAEGLEVHAHKLMLASCSAFFYYKFSKDRHLSVSNRIEIPNMSYEILLSVVSYLYTSEITITEENARDLLAAAYLFAIKDLQAACCGFLSSNLNSKNCIGTRNTASICHNENLVSLASDYLMANFSDVAKQEEFLEMSYEQVCDLISKDAISTSDEEEVLNCVIKWVKTDLQHRKVDIYSLMENVRFSLIPQRNFLQRLDAEEWLTSDGNYKEFLLQVLRRHIMDSSVECFPNPRHSSKCLLVFGATNRSVFEMELYDLDENIWLDVPEFSGMKFSAYTRAAVSGHTVYYSNGETLKFVNVSDSGQSEWSECSSQSDNISSYSMMVFNNSVYVVGGHGRERVSSAKLFNLSTSEWTNLPNMSEAKSDVGLSVFRRKLFVVGGNNKSSLDSVECYNPDSNTWSTMPSMLTNRDCVGVAALGDTLYAVGGSIKNRASKQVESLNPAEQSWTKLKDMNYARNGPGVTSFNGRLYVIGGADGKKKLDSVEVYCPTSNTWSMLPSSMKSGKWFVSVAVVDKTNLKICKMIK